MSEPLTVRREPFREIWSINLPAAGNAISGDEFVETLERSIARVNADLDVKAVILTGSGSIFSAGGNLRDLANRVGLGALTALEQRQAYDAGIQRIPRAMVRCEVPLIAAVNGPAIGAGCDLAMMCDLRIASTSAVFAESFVQLGLIPGDGGTWFLHRAVGELRAAEMTLTGDRIDANTALDWGIVSAVVPDELLLDEARALAERVTKNPAHTLRMAKRLLLESRTSSLDSLLYMAAAMQPLAHGDPAHLQRIERWRTAGEQTP